MILRAVLALILPFASPVLAEGFLLQPPIDCDLSGEGCYIQQYMDRDPGPGVTDYSCAGLSYDGHKGTDFAVPTLARMRAGVRVIASASGVVAGVRDGMPDTGFSPETEALIEGRECGNGVLVRHDDGWETQYCHMRQGSVTVSNGQRVTQGEMLGLVGQSGRAQFPHVHLSVRKDGAKIDPFDPDGTLTCATPGDSTLWADAPAYQPGGLIDVGLAAQVPEYSQVKAGTAARIALAADAPAVVVYGFLFGAQKGDILRLSIEGPEGTVIAQDVEIQRRQAQAFRAVGKTRRRGHWAVGIYDGYATLLRDGTVIDRMQTKAVVQ
tara:strand:- start:39 stop:1010 length:972 start_codon:yes stop_codon:yes gene_type:complete